MLLSFQFLIIHHFLYVVSILISYHSLFSIWVAIVSLNHAISSLQTNDYAFYEIEKLII